jgi:hypothetical protein
MLHRGLKVGVVLWAIALASGCGGGDANRTTTQASPSATTPGALSEDAYRKHATAICTDLDRKVAALGDPNRIPLAIYWGKVAELGEPALRRLAALKPPPSFAPRAREAVALAREEVRLIGEASKAMKASSDPQAVYQQRRGAIADVIAREDDLWLSLRIPACSDSQLPGEGPV